MKSFNVYMFHFQEAKGTSNGIFKKKRFFTTKEDHAVFVPLHKIRRQRNDWHKNARLRATEEPKPMKDSGNFNGLRIGERVVWISDTGPEKGVVKWIGYLPEEPNDQVTVGVDFVS